MAINFPTSLDNFTNPSSGNTLDSPSHSLQHSDLNDAVEAMQRKVGVGTAVAGSASAGQVLTISAAGTSTWSTPSASGLTQIVPTSVAVGSGSGSVDANGAVTFTGASSVSLNNCFSSTYQNYRILISNSASTGNQQFLRLRLSGTDTTTNYYWAGLYVPTSSTATIAGFNGSGSTSWFRILGSSNGNRTTSSIDVFNAQDALITSYNSNATDDYGYAVYHAGAINNTTQYDGFSVVASTGTMTGTLRVYGYKN